MAARRGFASLAKALARTGSSANCAGNSSSVLAPLAMEMLAASTSRTAGSLSFTAIRSFWASPSLMSTADLVRVLNEEIDHEKDYAAPEEIKSGPPAPFVLKEEVGDTLLTLTRKFGSESVSVDLHVNNQPSAEYSEEGAEEETLSVVVFNVSVTKGDQALVFECESDGTYVSVNHVAHEPTDSSGIQESTYSGPVFDELDENLQTQFRDYLQERGITVELGEYLRHLIFDKEQREYAAWLAKVSKFVK